LTLKILKDDQPWYGEGLHFSCTGCGQCCTGAPGYVWVSSSEIEEIATHLKMTIDFFSSRYLRKIQDRFSLIELPKTFDCIFLKDKKCQIYEVRPIQCRTFPWWPSHIASASQWKEAAQYCEGICDSAPLVPAQEIETQRSIQEKYTNM
jgi:uncharacterized protein